MKKWQPIRSRTGNEGWLTSYADLITNLLIFFVLILSASQIKAGKMAKIIEALSSERTHEADHSLPEAEKQIREKLKELNLDKQVTATITDEGLELSFNSGVMFPSGSSEILKEMQPALSQVLLLLAKYRDHYHFAVEGHTDETPMSSAQYKDNWSLSSARALQVRDRLEESGVAESKIRVEAYADTKSLPEDQLGGLSREQILAKHRRVVIRLY